jgi:hypothetical protein
MKKKTIVRALSNITVSISLLLPFVNLAAAQDTSDLIKQLKDKQKLQARAKKFDAAIAKLKPLRSKAKFDQKDIEAVDAFINETDDGVPIAVRAQSKAYAAAMDVKQFEDGVRAAAGKDAASFIESLQGNQRKILEISGARSAADAFSGSIREDADTLRTIGEKMKTQGKEPSAQNLFSSPDVKFRAISWNTAKPSDLHVHDPAPEELGDSNSLAAVQSELVAAALITLAAVYLGVIAFRLMTGAIKICVDSAITRYKSCVRRRYTGGLTALEEMFCRGVYLQDVSLCVLLPI